MASIKAIRWSRLQTFLNKLKVWRNQPNTYLSALSKLNIEEAKRAFLSKTDGDQQIIQNEIDEMLEKIETHLISFDELIDGEEDSYYVAFSELEKAAKVLFGKAFILLPPSRVSANCEQVLNSDRQDLLVGKPRNDGKTWGQERIQQWTQELAEVKKGTARFEEWQMVSNVWQEAKDETNQAAYQIIQHPTFTTYPWIGLPEDQIAQLVKDKRGVYKGVSVYQSPDTGETFPLADGKFYPDDSEGIVIYSDEPIVLVRGNTKQPQYGIVVEAFTELIPDKKMDTGLSFNYNAPNNEAPQALLLAMPSPNRDSDDWTEKMLQEIVYDTMDLMKIRMVDLEAMEKYGFVLPMTNWFNIPDVN